MDKLPAGTYELTISYNPQGLEYKAAEMNDEPEATTLELVVSRKDIDAKNFEFTPYEDLIYDAKEKTARVTSKLDTMGEITVKYYKDGSSEPMDTVPTEVGSYKVQIDVSESDNYVGKNNITTDDWKFEIKYLEVEPNPAYKISGEAYANGNTYWLKDDAQATIKAVDALAGYKISSTLNSEYKDSLQVDS